MITEIELYGFKSFVSASIGIKPLTVLTGLNSSGKSTVIQAIRIADNIARKENNILLEGHGDFEELTNDYVDKGITIIVRGDKGTIFLKNNRPKIPEGSVAFPKVIYISADRFGPKTSIPIDNSIELGSKGENIFHCIEKYRDEILPEKIRHQDSEGDTFLFNLQAWLGVILPNVKFQSYIQSKSDSSYSTFNEHRSTNVGFGLSYALPVITALLIGSLIPDSIVLIENPEAHLHPKGQTEMGRLISLCTEAGVQVVVETHSDHLFDGIRIYAKNNQGFAQKVITYWFELDDNDNTIVEEAQITEDGRVKNWPPGMFDQFEINASKLL